MFYSIVVNILSVLMRLLYKYEVHGEFIPEEGKRYVICSNHMHVFDPVSIGIAVKPQIHFMAKAELFKNKFISKILRGLNGFPVQRDGNDLGALKKAIKLLKENKVVGIFIEGTRVKSYNPNNAKPGPILIATMGNAEIIPIHIESTYKLFSKIKVTIKKPYRVGRIESGKNKDLEYTNKAKEVLDIIYNR